MPSKYNVQLSDDAIFLNRYLFQYRICIDRKNTLEIRKNEIIREFNYPIKAVSYDGLSRGGGENLGCAALSFRLDEINTRIREQLDRAAKILTDIMNVLDFLPENSMERVILEHRCIDRMEWNQICRKEHISRTPAIRYWRKGLYDLLEFKKVQAIVRQYKEMLEVEPD